MKKISAGLLLYSSALVLADSSVNKAPATNAQSAANFNLMMQELKRLLVFR